jgi:patatin-like phospholipase/acyl hydrolase
MYRILSIDGGGLHGYSSVILIRRLMEKRPDLLDKIDLVTGTSIGGILALGIASGHHISEVESNFLLGMPHAFTTNVFRQAKFFAGMCPKYDNSTFKDYLGNIFGENTLSDLKKKTLITTFCIDNEHATERRWKAKMLHNFEGPDSDGDFKVLDAAMATAAVPAFFPIYDKYIDGAFANVNPSLIAMCQTQDERAYINPRPKFSDLSVLSIGSIKNKFIEERNEQWGYFSWIKPLLEMFTEKDILITNYQCNTLIGHKYHRMQPVINASMDDLDLISSIKSIGMSYNIQDTLTWLDNNW